MLTKPEAGWTDFHLEGTEVYSLSYFNDIAFDWTQQAIHALETLSPFCVRGFLEPRRFLCVVSYWNCHIIVEDDERYPLDGGDIVHELSHTSMIEFCGYLRDDLREHFDDWVSFTLRKGCHEKSAAKAALLRERLNRLSLLITKSEGYFGEGRGLL